MVATAPDVETNARYSIKQTAEKLGISRRTVYRYISEKILTVQYRQAGNKPFVTGQDITKAWMKTL